MVKKLILILFSIASFGAAADQNNIESRNINTIKTAIKTTFIDPSFINTQIKLYDITDEKASILRSHYAQTALNDELISFIAKKIVDKNIDITQNKEKFLTYLSTIYERLYLLGVYKLETKDIELDIRKKLQIATLLPPKECKAFHFGNSTINQNKKFNIEITKIMWHRLSPDDMNAYYALKRKALSAVFNKHLPYKELEEWEREFATKAYSDQMLKDLLVVPQEKKIAMVNAINNPDSVSDEYACFTGNFMLMTALNVPESDKKIVYRFLQKQQIENQ